MSPVHIRTATAADVPVILAFIRELAAYEQLEHQVVASEALLEQHLFGERRLAEALVAETSDGPEGFASPWLERGGRYAHRFTKPGTYLLHCSLHSAYMSQVVTVTHARPRPRDEDLPRR